MSFVDVLSSNGVELRRAGAHWVARCPFHEERTPSFHVWEDHGHCYGCGWHGGVFRYVMDREGCDYGRAKEILRGRGCMPKIAENGRMGEWANRRVEKPELPALFSLNQDGIGALANLRCLAPAGIRAACEAGVMFGARWFDAQCWVVTDAARRVAQFRRFDGKPFFYQGREIKAMTKGEASWPVGSANLNETENGRNGEWANVVMVEGGPDLLAAYCLRAQIYRVAGRFVSPEFTPVAMLGASAKIGSDALGLFEGKRVRILRHDDEAGANGARVWAHQLVAAGAAVATCCFSRLSSQKQMVDALLDFNF